MKKRLASLVCVITISLGSLSASAAPRERDRNQRVAPPQSPIIRVVKAVKRFVVSKLGASPIDPRP